ncbi:hypothetical protein ACIQU5_18825 [Streptomyces sp. NPDC090306]|uniref:hypothetical protein n=1 Tax=unclassified Streptomyces TaxID=2593676 RepID=UPI0036EC6DB6
MTEVVDSDELLRRIRRARDCAAQEERRWRAGASPETAPSTEDAGGAADAAVRSVAYQAVGRVLDEILTPGRTHDGV